MGSELLLGRLPVVIVLLARWAALLAVVEQMKVYHHVQENKIISFTILLLVYISDSFSSFPINVTRPCYAFTADMQLQTAKHSKARRKTKNYHHVRIAKINVRTSKCEVKLAEHMMQMKPLQHEMLHARSPHRWPR